MFTNIIVIFLTLTNVFYVQSRPEYGYAENVPVINEQIMKTLLNNPSFTSYLQQLITYFSSLQGQQGQFQQSGQAASQEFHSQQSSSQSNQGGQAASQVFQSQQSNSQSNSQQASTISQDTGAALSSLVSQSEQTQAAASVAQVSSGKDELQSSQVSSVSQSGESSVPAQSSQSAQSSEPSLAQGEGIIENRNGHGDEGNSTTLSSQQSQNVTAKLRSFQQSSVNQAAQSELQQNEGKTVANQVANLIHHNANLQNNFQQQNSAAHLAQSSFGSKLTGDSNAQQGQSASQIAQSNFGSKHVAHGNFQQEHSAAQMAQNRFGTKHIADSNFQQRQAGAQIAQSSFESNHIANSNVQQERSAAQIAQNNALQSIGNQIARNIASQQNENFQQNSASHNHLHHNSVNQVAQNTMQQNGVSQVTQAQESKASNINFENNSASHFGQNAADHTFHGHVTHNNVHENAASQIAQHHQQSGQVFQSQQSNVAQNNVYQNAASHIAHHNQNGQASNVQNAIFHHGHHQHGQNVQDQHHHQHGQHQHQHGQHQHQHGQHLQGAHTHYNTEEEKRTALNAKYDFATLVDDNINGNYQFRQESRQGGKVTGHYSYDDGAIMRTVFYEADDKGFRILKEEVLPSAKSVANLDGNASVKSYFNGDVLDYQISTKDIHEVKHLNKVAKIN